MSITKSLENKFREEKVFLQESRNIKSFLHGMSAMANRLWSFQGRDTKLERFLAKNQL